MHKFTTTAFLVTLAAAATAFGLDNPPATTAPATAAAPANEAATNNSGAHIQFAVPVYDFGRVKAGELVKYTFMFTNVGDQALELSNVQPSCGCTTAGEFTHKVMPGETGKVPIQFNSANFNGQVFKTISVTSNDKQKPVTVLQLKGTIWKPLELNPAYTVLNVPPDATSASATVRIINNTDDPVTFSEPESNNKSFTGTLTTTKPGKEYQLAIASEGPLNTGNVQGKISLKTSWTNIPSLDVPYWVNVQPALSVIPPHIMLPRVVSAKTPTTVTIQNNSTNQLTLSDPAVNASGVEVEIKEVQPGKVYHALLTFPDGFELPPGQQVALTVKSSSPRMPEVRVPVSQTPKPATPVAPQPNAQKPASAGTPQPAASARAN